jgi:four helix bundle protein
VSNNNFRTLDLAFYEDIVRLNYSGHLRDQLLRASSSIPLNLSEGNAKFSVKEKKRYYLTAYASLKECRTLFKMIKAEDSDAAKKADRLGAMLYKLVDSKITEIIRPKF